MKNDSSLNDCHYLFGSVKVLLVFKAAATLKFFSMNMASKV